MNVLDQLLSPKLSNVDTEKVSGQWKDVQMKLVDAFLNKRGIHTDEIANFNSYLPEIINLLREHVKLYYVDQQDQLHHIHLRNIKYRLPYEERVGIDDPEKASLRNHYEAQIYATVIYTIHVKPDPEEKIKDEPMTPCEEEEEEEEEEDMEKDDDDPEEEEEEEEEDDEDEDNYSEDDQEDNEDDMDEDDDEEDDQHIENKGKSRHTATYALPAFFIQKDDFSAYSVQIFKDYDHHHICSIPVWIGSSLCMMSTPMRSPSLFAKPYFRWGCTYLTSRNFKLCPYEEYYTNNQIMSYKSDKIEIRSKFYHITKRFRTNCTLKITVEQCNFKKTKNWVKPFRFMLQIPHENPPVFCPITVLAMAYGWTPRDFIDAVRMFLRYQSSPEIDMFLRIVGMDVEQCRHQKDAILRMSKCLSKCKTMDNAEDIASYVSFTLRGEFLPNLIDMESDNNHAYENLRKGYLLAEAVAELIQLNNLVNNKRTEPWKIDDKRSYALKRIDTPGEKLAFLSRKYIKHYAKKGSSKLKALVDNKKSIDLKNVLNKKMIKLTNSVKNGIWDSKSDASDSNQNKTQMMITGFCSDDIHAQTQKIVKFAMKKNSNLEPLLTHPTQAGRVDLYRTPESEKCGIIRNKALGGYITPLVDSVKMMKVIFRILQHYQSKIGWLPIGSVPQFPDRSYTMIKDVFGGIIGWVRDPFAMYTIFLKFRRRSAIYNMLGMKWDRKRDIFTFNCDEGRIMRPLIILERFHQLLDAVATPSFIYHHDPVAYLLEKGVIEYLDAEEEYCGLVFTAGSWDETIKANFIHTHMEIHGVFSLTLTVSKAFCNHNQGPRRMYTGNMESRSIGLKLFEDRGTTSCFSLWYGQDPLMSDPVDQALGLRHAEPNGFNVMLAVLSTESNMEDAYTMKKEAFERGLAMSTETLIQTTSLGDGCTFQKPDGRTRGKAHSEKYKHLLPDGTPRIGDFVTGGDAIIGKVFAKKDGSEMKRRCISKFLPWNVNYRVKSVDKYPDNELKPPKIIRTSLYKINEPGVGDKFYLAHGQKGTMSRKVPAIDMPFICSGLMAGTSPDLLINVASLSRITQGLLLETLMGKARAINPTLIAQYETVFLSEAAFDEKLRLCCAILKSSGLNYTGKERMRMGTTGELIQCEVFTGMVHMRVLKHMAKEKLRSRDRGPVNELTRQTSVGKKHFGGQKEGEMENWNLHCYGMPAVFQNINHESADKFLLYLCTQCNNFAMGCQQTGFYFCKSCQSSDHIVRLPNTYITNLSFQELYCAGFGHAIVAEPTTEEDIELDEDVIFEQYKNLSL